jgi:Spy/CpxP family protein refolding chaperone
MLAGTVLAGTLAFAAQVAAQQNGGQAQGVERTDHTEHRGPGGRGGRGGRQDPTQMVERRVSMLTERLTLSETQAVSIREILLDEQKQMEALRPEGFGGPRGPRGERGDSAGRGERTRPDSAARAQRPARPDSATMAQVRAQMDALRSATDGRIEGVLNAEQRTAYRELVAARGERPEGGRGPGGPGGRGGRGPGQGGPDRAGQRTPPPSVA